MRKGRHLGWLVCISITMYLVAGSASGAGISINSLPDWDQALRSGMIKAVDFSEFRRMVNEDEHWNQTIMLNKGGTQVPFNYRESLLFTPQLRVEMHEEGGAPGLPGPLQQRTEPALIMRWGDPAQTPGEGMPQVGQRVGAAWDLVLGGPNAPGQDFTTGDARLEFSVHGPAECMIVSVNMLDNNGNYREWWWHVGFGPGDIPPCEWTDVWVDPVSGASSLNPVMYFTHGGGVFDPSNIKYIRFDENGIWSPEFRDMQGIGLVWNAWDHVQTVPEPVTLLTLVMGAGVLGTYLRHRRRA